MKRIQHVASNIGLGCGACFGFFMIPTISELFTPTFLVLVRQFLAMTFAVCLMISPRALVDIGENFAPKIITILNTLFSKNNGNNKPDNHENN